MKLSRFFTQVGLALLRSFAEQRVEELRVDDKTLFIAWLRDNEELRRRVSQEVAGTFDEQDRELAERLVDFDLSRWVAICERCWLTWLMQLQPPRFQLDEVVISLEMRVAGGPSYCVVHAIGREEDEQLVSHLGLYIDSFRDLIAQTLLDSQLDRDRRLMLSTPIDSPQASNVEGGFTVWEMTEPGEN